MQHVRFLLAVACVPLAGACAVPVDSPRDYDDRSASLACPPADLFGAALCLCGDLSDVGAITVGDGPSGVGSVGVNGRANLVNAMTVSGDLIAMDGFHAVSRVSVAGDMVVDDDAAWVASMEVGGDLGVGGDAQGVGQTSVGGSLRILGQERLLGPTSVADRGDYQGPASPPCPCEGDDLFDVAAAVAAVASDNDNASAGLDEAITGVGATTVELDTGVYYLADSSHVGRLTFAISGDVALYVAGSIDAVGEEVFSLAPGATLDLFVAGSVRTVGRLSAGSASDPQAFRLYVGADSGVLTVGDQDYFGSIYAPEADVAFVGATHVVGSLIGRSLAGVGTLRVDFGGPEVNPPSCEEPDGGGDGGGDDPGGDDGGRPQVD